MVDVPVATAVARPVPAMVATEVVVRGPGHLAGEVLGRSCRRRCRWRRTARSGPWEARVGRRERRWSSAAAVTVRTVEPVTPPSLAVMVDVPVPAAVARPCEPAVLEMVATEVVAEAQVTWLVRFCVELSEKVPVAVNCSVSPLATVGLAGVTAIDFRSPRCRP